MNKKESYNKNYFPELLTWFNWVLFILSIFLLIYSFNKNIFIEYEGYFRINGLTLIMWSVVTFFCSIVHSYSLRYMAGFKKLNSFLLTCFGFTLSVMFLVVTQHYMLFTGLWLIMGMLMAELIGNYTGWQESRPSAHHARKYFLLSTILLAASLLLLSFKTNTSNIDKMAAMADQLPKLIILSAGILMLIAGMIQSALYPFQSWLMSSMTAPTPASALMHAGFVNAGGILLALFAPLFFQLNLLTVIFITGAAGALIGKAWKLVQTNIKRKLACSTVAQMGFMFMQCGLGFFTAAIAHLILHGFYKAYLFLSSGSRVEHTVPETKYTQLVSIWKWPVLILTGLAGGLLFGWLTGKGVNMDSGLFLTFIIILTVIHGSHEILRNKEISPFSKIIGIPILTIPAISLYALFFNGVTLILHNMSMVHKPVPLNIWHVGVAMVYLITFIIIEFRWYKKSKKLYVYLLNDSHPKAETILN